MAIGSLIPWRRDRDTDPFTALQHQMNRLFDEITSPFAGRGEATGFGGGFTPRVDLSETPERYELTAELPGISEKDVDVSVAGNVLTLRGEKKAEREERRENCYVAERSYGSFHRAFTLPQDVDADRIEGRYDNGVLKVMLPKSAEAQKGRRRIDIKS